MSSETTCIAREQVSSAAGHRSIIFDSCLLDRIDARCFEPDAADRIESGQLGRAPVVMHRYQGLELVNRHYHRGGWMAPLFGDRYFGTDVEKSRAFREWMMLYRMRELGLPVPVPVAASVIRASVFYRADLVTQRVPDSETLADACTASVVQLDVWRAIGATIKRFHDNDVFHADLNARNILLQASGDVLLIDFDKGCFRQLGDSWRHSNLSRLKRSLDKFSAKSSSFHFEERDWQALLEAYRSS